MADISCPGNELVVVVSFGYEIDSTTRLVDEFSLHRGSVPNHLYSKGRFAGLLTRAAILEWAKYRLVGGPDRFLSVGQIRAMVTATKVKDLARSDWRSLGVKVSDSLQTALGQMVDLGEDALPVLDDEGRILGDIRLSEILEKAIEMGRLAQEKG